MASTRQVSANRENGLKGGVKTDEGKLVSRLNARKHGIFASALTTEDSEDLYGVEDRLVASLRPVGPVEEMLVEKLALTYLRMQRCARAEAQFHYETWTEAGEPTYRGDSRPSANGDGSKVTFKSSVFERMVKLIDLYDARLTNQFLKLLHEIERRQALRAGETASPQRPALRSCATLAGEEEHHEHDEVGQQNTGESNGEGQTDSPRRYDGQYVRESNGGAAGRVSGKAMEHGSDTTPQAASAEPALAPAASLETPACPPEAAAVSADLGIQADAGTERGSAERAVGPVNGVSQDAGGQEVGAQEAI